MRARGKKTTARTPPFQVLFRSMTSLLSPRQRLRGLCTRPRRCALSTCFVHHHRRSPGRHRARRRPGTRPLPRVQPDGLWPPRLHQAKSIPPAMCNPTAPPLPAPSASTRASSTATSAGSRPLPPTLSANARVALACGASPPTPRSELGQQRWHRARIAQLAQPDRRRIPHDRICPACEQREQRRDGPCVTQLAERQRSF